MIKIAEFTSIFILLPLIFYLKIVPSFLIMPALWVVFLYAYYVMKSDGMETVFKKIYAFDLNFVLLRFAFYGLILFLFVYIFYEEKMFNFMFEKTALYIVVMFLYPILSVIPQEFVFRRFFFHRYNVFKSKSFLVYVNALAFGFVHLAFGNFLAVGLSILGGYIFAKTYLRTKSFSLVCIEHALYGDLIFTIGLGEFFYHNNGMH
jgi:membrane protease YdiL (CAAX protease family)